MKKEIEQTEAEYIHFGDEWVKEMKKFTKEELIWHYRRVCIELKQLTEHKIKTTKI